MPADIVGKAFHTQTYLTVSAEPASPPTVENRTINFVRFPTDEKSDAFVYFVISLVTSK